MAYGAAIFINLPVIDLTQVENFCVQATSQRSLSGGLIETATVASWPISALAGHGRLFDLGWHQHRGGDAWRAPFSRISTPKTPDTASIELRRLDHNVAQERRSSHRQHVGFTPVTRHHAHPLGHLVGRRSPALIFETKRWIKIRRAGGPSMRVIPGCPTFPCFNEFISAVHFKDSPVFSHNPLCHMKTLVDTVNFSEIGSVDTIWTQPNHPEAMNARKTPHNQLNSTKHSESESLRND
jgi:hypothetical protein